MSEVGFCSHCASCTTSKCTHQPFPLVACELVHCDQQCGAIFHKCKNQEHLLFCPNEKISCCNKTYGCPITLMRKEQANHLSVCPASVVHCNMEWNRWPVYCSERKARVPFTQSNYHAKYGQLDVALALRDQRVLNEARKLPKSTRNAFKNPLTRFPAVPLKPKSSSFDPQDEENEEGFSSDEEIDHQSPWQKLKYPPGLSRSVCHELVSDDSKYEEESQNSQSDQICDKPEAYCDSNCDKGEGDAASTRNDVPSPPSPPALMLQELLGLEINAEFITRYQSKPVSMYTFLCAQSFRRDEYVWHFRNVHDDIHAGLNGWLQRRCPLAQYGCTYSVQRFHPDHPGNRVVYSPLLESFGVKTAAPELTSVTSAPETDYDLYKNNREINQKQKEYTPEVFTPVNFKGSIQVNGSRLHRQSSKPEREETPPRAEDQLTSLPFELLQYLTRFLDPFSLCNVSLTCKKLREVCCSILEHRGIVILEWRGRRVDGQVKWTIAHKRWFFSSAFTPVKKWVFADNPSMSEHIKNCSFYQKHPADDRPVKLYSMPASMENPGYYKALQRMFPDHDFGWSEEYLKYCDEMDKEIKSEAGEVIGQTEGE